MDLFSLFLSAIIVRCWIEVQTQTFSWNLSVLQHSLTLKHIFLYWLLLNDLSSSRHSLLIDGIFSLTIFESMWLQKPKYHISVRNFPLWLCFKGILSGEPFIWRWTNMCTHGNKTNFYIFKSRCPRTWFETGAKGNSEMIYLSWQDRTKSGSWFKLFWGAVYYGFRFSLG